MQERNEFWKGVTVGLLGGIAIGVLTRVAVARSLVIESQLASARKPQRKIRAAAETEAPAKGLPATARTVTAIAPREFVSRREAAESAGDPRVTSPGSHSTLAEVEGKAFERPPGAPGGQTPAERLEAPGRPGKHMDEATGATRPAPKRPRTSRAPK